MARITAEVAGFDYEFVRISEDAKEEYKKDVYFAGTFPYLQDTESGEGLGESAAIARFIANSKPDAGLYGTSAFESGQIDEVIDSFFYTNTTTSSKVFASIIGYLPIDEETFKESQKKFKDYIRTLDEKVKDREFIVGDKLTIADIYLVSVLNFQFAILLDAGFRKAIPNLVKYYTTIRNTDVFVKYFGKPRFAGKGFKPKTL